MRPNEKRYIKKHFRFQMFIMCVNSDLYTSVIIARRYTRPIVALNVGQNKGKEFSKIQKKLIYIFNYYST